MICFFLLLLLLLLFIFFEHQLPSIAFDVTRCYLFCSFLFVFCYCVKSRGVFWSISCWMPLITTNSFCRAATTFTSSCMSVLHHKHKHISERIVSIFVQLLNLFPTSMQMIFHQILVVLLCQVADQLKWDGPLFCSTIQSASTLRRIHTSFSSKFLFFAHFSNSSLFHFSKVCMQTHKYPNQIKLTQSGVQWGNK